MADTPTEISSETWLYNPSWFDRFNNWINNLPVSVWTFHLSLGVGLVIIQLLFLWLDRGLYAGELLPVIIFNGLAVPLLLVLINLYDNQAVNALSILKPVLETSEEEFKHYEYKLANMPILPPLVAGSILTVFTILTPLVTIDPVRYAALEELPVFRIVYHIIDKGSAFLFGVVIYHTIRQLRLVNLINSCYIRINLFQLRPLQAFSSLTASTSLGLVIFVYAWMLINPDLLTDPVLFGFALIITILVVIVFAWPLWGVHKLIENEKQKTLHDLDHQTEDVFEKFNQYLHDGDLVAAEKLTGTISSLEIQHKRISTIPTWPWSSETARLALTAIALPLILMILQYFIFQVLDQ